MSLLVLDNICLSFSEKRILENVSLSVKKGEKIAIVGRNGAGKSTLMKIIAGIVQPDDGEIKIKNDINISYLEQLIPVDIDKNLFTVVAEGLGDIGLLLAKYQNCLDIGDIDKSIDYQKEIEKQNAWHYFHKIEKIIERFVLNPKANINKLSGGWRRRAMLAKALINEPDILLLDEPTNHMDIGAILSLEKIIKDFRGALIFISHDRYFMQNIASKVFDIDMATLSVFDCNYLDYIKRKDELINAQNLAHNRFTKKLAQEEIWIRQGIKARRTRNEGRLKNLKEMRQKYINLHKKQGLAKIHKLESEKNTAKIIFEVENVSYKNADAEIIKDFSTIILKGEKIAIIGANGSGKSTLIKILLKQLQPYKGIVKSAKNLEIAYFDQMRENLNAKMIAMDFIAEGKSYININGKDKHIIGYMRQFLFTGKQAMSPISTFSGGEKNRLMLAKILSKPANILILDEPSNDLDIETLELLEEMLTDYNGTLILASHDRVFVNNIVSSTIVMEKNAKINKYNGGYDDYLRHNKENNIKIINKVNNKKNKAKNNKLSYKDKQKLELITANIELIEDNIKKSQKKLMDPNFYKDNDFQNEKAQLDEMQKKIKLMYEEWGKLDS